MTQLNALLDLANAAAEETEVDMSQTSTGGGGRRILPAGYAMARFIRYIETGKHPREFQGKAKEPALMFRLTFALYGEGYQNEDGSPAILSGFSMPLGNNEKAKAKIAYDRMNYKGTAKAFAQMLGQPFLVNVKVKKSKQGKEYNEIEWKDTLPPFDPVTKQQYPVPEAPAELYQLFLWNRPTKEMWDALYIEGTRDDGKSKNFLQEECLTAIDFEGSALHHLLQEHGAVPAKPKAEATAPAVPSAPAAEQKAAPEAPAAPAMPAQPAEAPEPPVANEAPAMPGLPPMPQL